MNSKRLLRKPLNELPVGSRVASTRQLNRARRPLVPFSRTIDVRSDTDRPKPLDKGQAKCCAQREGYFPTAAVSGTTRELSLCEGTVKLHFHHIFRKLGVRIRTALMMALSHHPTDELDG